MKKILAFLIAAAVTWAIYHYIAKPLYLPISNMLTDHFIAEIHEKASGPSPATAQGVATMGYAVLLIVAVLVKLVAPFMAGCFAYSHLKRRFGVTELAPEEGH